jgi:hypothetical protein
MAPVIDIPQSIKPLLSDCIPENSLLVLYQACGIASIY